MTLWRRVLLEKLTVLKVVKKIPYFTQLEGSITCSQKLCHQGMERPRVADGEDSLNIWAEAREGKVFRLWGVNGANNSL